MTTEHFVLKPNGKIYWVEKMPDRDDFTLNYNTFERFQDTEYQQALQSAIDNAVEVSNQKIVKYRLLLSGQHRTHGDEGELKLGTPYSLQCSVEKKEIHTGMVFVNSQTSGSITKTVALVTFSQPEREETQEETYRVLLLASYCGDNDNCTENHPCPDCLQMCNVYEVPKPVILLPKCVGNLIKL